FAGQRRRQVYFAVAVEEGEELVVLALAQRIVLVIVALAAADGHAEPDLAGGVDAIDAGLDAALLLIDAAFLGGQRVAVDAVGDLLSQRGARQQVAGQLLDGELVERQVAIERADEPVPIAPGEWPAGVLFVAVTVGIAGQVEPVAAPALAIMRAVE